MIAVHSSCIGLASVQLLQAAWQGPARQEASSTELGQIGLVKSTLVSREQAALLEQQRAAAVLSLELDGTISGHHAADSAQRVVNVRQAGKLQAKGLHGQKHQRQVAGRSSVCGRCRLAECIKIRQLLQIGLDTCTVSEDERSEGTPRSEARLGQEGCAITVLPSQDVQRRLRTGGLIPSTPGELYVHTGMRKLRILYSRSSSGRKLPSLTVMEIFLSRCLGPKARRLKKKARMCRT